MLGSAVGLAVGSLAGCLTGDGADGDASTPTETTTDSPTPSPTPTAPPDAEVAVYFADGPELPGNGIEVEVRALGDADAAKVYVSAVDSITRWYRLGAPGSVAIYRTEEGHMAESISADIDVEKGGRGLLDVGWGEGRSPERTVEVYAIVDDAERLLVEKSGEVG